jgi:hypothetical protein
VGLFRRKPRTGGAPMDRAATKDDVRHLAEFARSRVGVEAYVEPQTFATETTVVLVATDGEWTRRRVDGPKEAYRLAEKWGIPVYDAGIVGYPPRMREWTARERERRDRL